MARVRIGDRLSGTALALLLQGGFLFLLLQSVHVITRTVAPRELTLVLPRLLERPPAAPARASRSATRPDIAIPSPARLPAPPPTTGTPQDGVLKGLGQSLFGCAPEAYAMLSPQDRVHCPKPGENRPLTTEEELNPKSHSKNAATWQEDLDERHFDYSSCFGAELVETCMIRLGVQERKRAKQERTFIASDKAKANTPVKPPVPNVPARRDN